MEVLSVKIKSFRTIADEAELDLRNGITLVGPNNTGKTNFLKALRLFFTGRDNLYGYSRKADLTFNQSSSQTSITMTFRGNEDEDKQFFDNLDQLHSLVGTTRGGNTEFTVYLTFSVNSTPVYRIFPNAKRPKDPSPRAKYSRIEHEFIDDLIKKFSVHYIPSEKSFRDLYEDLLLPFLVKHAYSAIEPQLMQIMDKLGETATEVNARLHQAGLQDLTAAFHFPDDKPEGLLGKIELKISDPGETSIFEKGMGVQSAVLLSAFNWITNQERNSGQDVIWLLEEPESYLHPELSDQCSKLIESLRLSSLVVCTTHSLGFVPQDPKRVIGTTRGDDGNTAIETFSTWHSATSRIRKALGVRFSDFYNFNFFNALVEGETDRNYITWILTVMPDAKSRWPRLTSSEFSILDFGGVKGLEGFLRATYEFIRQERICCIIFDGDTAGDKARADLQHYFGKKSIPFQPNHQFVSVRDRFPIEGLFPDEWIKKAHQEHPSWFQDFSEDAHGTVAPFRLDDSKKKNFMQLMKSYAETASDFSWADKWAALLTAIDKTFDIAVKALNPSPKPTVLQPAKKRTVRRRASQSASG